MINIIQISVLELVTFVLRSGDIDQRFRSQTKALDGIRAHQAVQKEYLASDRAEYFFKDETTVEDVIFQAQGRADGVLFRDGRVIIDEIKSTSRDLEEIQSAISQLHWAQGMCYAYFYAKANERTRMDVQLTYYQVESQEIKRFSKTFDFEDLQTFYLDALDRYMEFTRWRIRHSEVRQNSIERLKFPFPTYREGQKELAYAVYDSIRRSHHLFCEAPTGIGKTISTLFPMIKAMGESLIDKVFYLTARSTAKKVCWDALHTLTKRGLRILAIDLTAKEKICINDKVSCNPEDCPYAKGHYDRVNTALLDTLENAELVDGDELKDWAEKHNVCPFELGLDISVFSDVIVGDYNYAFNPQTYLRRFFELNVQPYGFLVDEAHNLVDRGRDMFTTSLWGDHFNEAVGLLDESEEYRFIIKRLFAVMKIMDKLFSEVPDKRHVIKDAPEDLYFPVRRAMKDIEVFLVKAQGHAAYDPILSLYFELNSFIRIMDTYTDGFVTVVDAETYEIKLFCVDTSAVLRQTLSRAKSAIFFSATLTPLHFYKRLLGGGEESYVLRLRSPFPTENLSIHIASAISTRYRHRTMAVPEIVEVLYAMVSAKRGNYFAFFPSYAYLAQVAEAFSRAHPEVDLLIQDSGASEEERKKFLDKFKEGENRLGFAVLGGVFAEGIDLTGDRLIGAAIVSVGIPGISYERDIIRDYFEEREKTGYAYAYLYPGLNKVLQAAGRVIRTENDRGTLLLIDDRYVKDPYPGLFPPHWTRVTPIHGQEDLQMQLKSFWNENRQESS